MLSVFLMKTDVIFVNEFLFIHEITYINRSHILEETKFEIGL